MNSSVSLLVQSRYQIEAGPGQKIDCPSCGHRTFSIKADDTVAKCFHPGCGLIVNASSNPRVSPATVQPRRGLTLAEYATAKGIPIDFLQVLNLTDTVYVRQRAIRIPYYDEGLNETAVRYRLALSKGSKGDERFRWEKGARPIPYGLWVLGDARTVGHVVICEGESDAQTLWLHCIPALGLPGANTWKEEWAAHLEGIPRIYVVIEPDAGGEAIRKWLAQSSIRDRCWLITLSGAKDPSELHGQDPDRFTFSWQEAIDTAVPFSQYEGKRSKEIGDVLLAKCSSLACEHNVLDRFQRDVEKTGLAGEGAISQILYLAVISRLLDDPVSIAVKGPSSGGKSYLVRRVLDFFPKSAYFALSAMSDKALAYSQEPLSHRFLVLYESAGLNSETATYLLRSLLSEGHIRYETVERTKNGLEPRLIERPGPTGLIVTTTAIQLHPENETRMLSVTVTDSREQTKNVLMAIAAEDNPEVDMTEWVAFQEWLAHGVTRVTVPFAKQLASRIPPVAVRLRRDFKVVLTLVRAHALLHRENRPRDAQGRIIAVLEDYSVVRELTAGFLGEGAETSVPENVRETVCAVTDLLESRSEVTVNEVAGRLGLDKSAALRRVRNAIRRGFLVNQEERKGRPARLVIGDPVPEASFLLPPAQELSGCMVADETAGLAGRVATPTLEGLANGD